MLKDASGIYTSHSLHQNIHTKIDLYIKSEMIEWDINNMDVHVQIHMNRRRSTSLVVICHLVGGGERLKNSFM